MIDLRSDTVTLPSPEMRDAMYRAEVGDDGYGEDPTVARLEQLAAQRTGKEASLFVSSGCLANLVSLLTFCHGRSEVILGRLTDLYIYEVGAMSFVGGIHPYPIDNRPDGTLDIGEVKAAIREKDLHFPETRVICLENTNCLCGGVPLTPAYCATVKQLGKEFQIPVYLDGARIFNAAIALQTSVADLAKEADALMFCLSKGLGCPVGSMICGSQDFVDEARHYRKMLGGQMRQAGIIAAAGVVALERMVDRLVDDHRNARALADGLRDTKGLALKNDVPASNMVFFKLNDGRMSQEVFARCLEENGVKVLPMGNWLRAVTHYGIEMKDAQAAGAIIRRVVQAG